MKRLYLVRGLSGSGKSTVARALAVSVRGGEAIEADEFFVGEDGIYVFDGSRLPEAHQDCLSRAQDLMEMPGIKLVAVANTFSQRWEMEPYIHLADKLGWTVTAIECTGDHGNVHDVPENAIQRMRDRWESVQSFVSDDR